MASSSSAHPWKYDVFLSFRGEDTRRSFTDHLHKALCRYGINTFIDDRLRRGEQISLELLQAIEESRFSIVIFSQHYASSSWCLEELTKILECVELRGHKALPVFYKVDPSDVRNQRGSYGEAFAKHEQEVYKDKLEKVLKWRNALTVAAGFSGWDSRGRHESEVINEIVSKIRSKLVDVSSSYMEGLVGMDSCLQDMVSLLRLELDDVRIIGVWGMAGIGKTTIAEVVYQRFCTQFQGCCFLSNVREKSLKGDLTDLQIQLISEILGEANHNTRNFHRGNNFIEKALRSKQVLIVLDDVNHGRQLEALAGNREWFGPGSRIIIATREKRLLIEKEVDAIYEVEELKRDQSLVLFCQHAFRQAHPTKDFGQLCDHALNYTKGIPLALKVLGSFLYKRDQKEWDSGLGKLKRIPNKEIQDVLRTSFDALDDDQKDIFLDIACFYKGQDKDYITKILKSCDFSPEIEISILTEKSLITISNNKLHMHDLIQEMGWEIVRQESIKDPGKRSRLLVNEDVIRVLTTNSGTEAVEGMVLNLSTLKELHFSVNVFKKMNKLRVLRICFGDHEKLWGYNDWYKNLNSSCGCNYWNRKQDARCKLHLSGDFKFLSNNLRYLCWHGYPLKSLPSNFHPEKLVELDMCFSWLEQLWEGKKSFPNLEFINICQSPHLVKTPDFSGAPKLSRIILEYCTSLVKVHPSIVALKNLIILNLRGCKNFRSFLTSIHMESLQILNFSGCSNFEKFPEVQGNMDNLSKLYLNGTAIKRLPSSIEYLHGLTLLNLGKCTSLESLPSCVFKLKSLRTLILSKCLTLKKLPVIRENMESLKELLLDETGLRELPSSIEHLNGLVLLNLRNCKELASLPGSISKLTSLQTLTLSGCSFKVETNESGIQEEPTSITRLSKPEELSLAGCKGGESMSRTLALCLRSSSPREGFRLASLSSLCFLKELNLSDCNLVEGAVLSDLSSLSSLEHLDLSKNGFITLPGSLFRLPRLIELTLEHCKSLQSLPEIISPRFRSLCADGCTSLETFPCPSSAYPLWKFLHMDFIFSNCFRLVGNKQRDSVEPLLQLLWLAASKHQCEREERFNHGISFNQIIVPGSSIPEWFIHHSAGCSITVELPPDWHRMVKGFAACAAFRKNESGRIPLGKRAAHFSKADHIWFGYITLDESDYSQTVDHIEFLFGEEVKECGLRLIYKDDVMENKPFLSAPCGRMKNYQFRGPFHSFDAPTVIGSNGDKRWRPLICIDNNRWCCSAMKFQMILLETNPNC